MTSSLPLLCVPYVPLKKIIDFMEFSSLVSMSLCSQKCQSVIKTYRRKSIDWRLYVSCFTHFFLSFHKFCHHQFVVVASGLQKMTNRTRFVEMNGQNVALTVNEEKGFLETHWKDEVNGLKILTDYVTQLFNIDVLEITFNRKNIWMIDWVNSRQQSHVTSVYCEDWKDTLTEDELTHILRDCPASFRTVIYPSPPPNFQFRENFRSIDYLSISDGSWVTIDNLLTMDGREIMLFKSSLTSININTLLKHWLAGGSPRLKLFSAKTVNLDLDALFADINVVLVESLRQYTSPSQIKCRFSFGYDLRRKDGVTATVHYYRPDGGIIIAVWPEIVCYH
ncbi:hypothetical protein CRE_12291 [Caenorhabditis remanei]|uniref:F-box domain-containing protein n=1 Tax=Caenorhabditis remanei TaxID=31234 RepID=E3NEN8_CAERE|nr:hypothetical protein CRE_12291 [Caenorhabditis remanei]